MLHDIEQRILDPGKETLECIAQGRTEISIKLKILKSGL